MAATSILKAVSRRLEGKVALITGGASGIGLCTAKLFTQRGAKVILADVQDDLGRSACKTLGSSASYVHCDVADESQIRAAVERAMTEHGKLDVMFNNAGIADRNEARIIDNNRADFERVLRTNVTGVFLGIKHAARVMIPARRGSIISTASVSSTVGGAASHAYACSKHAVAGLTRNAAAELGQFGVRVNCVSPYLVPTPLSRDFIGAEDDEKLEDVQTGKAILRGVAFRAEDVAEGVAFLASDEARYVSGHNLFIDGGFTAVGPPLDMFQYPSVPVET